MLAYPLTRSVHLAAHRAAAQQFTRALERFFDDGIRPAAPAEVRTPRIDVVETDTAYRVAFEVPGVGREQLRATIEGRRLVLETVEPVVAPAAGGDAEATVAAPASAERTLYRERTAARYARTVILPAEVDAASADARLENGVLTLTIAKKVPAGAVPVRVA